MFLWWKSCCSCKVQEVKDGRLSSRIDTSWIENSVNVYFFSSNNHFQKNCNKKTQIFFFPKKSFEIYVNIFFTSSNHPFNKIQPPQQNPPLFFRFPPQLFPMDWTSSLQRYGPRYLVKVGRKGEPRMGRGLPFSSMSFTWITSLGWWWEPKGSQPRGTPRMGGKVYPRHLTETERKTPW